VSVLNDVPQQGRNNMTYQYLLTVFNYFAKPMT
jgi:hypothetical protein